MEKKQWRSWRHGLERAMASGRDLTIELTGGRVVEGPVTEVADDHLVMKVRGHPCTFEREEVVGPQKFCL